MIIDEEFKSLIPPLTADEYRQLEENILKDGIRDSLVIWDNKGDWILIDGHNRYEIAKKHNLPFNHRRMEFPDREAVKEWIIRNQFGRRNLSAYDRSLLALKLKPMIAEKAKENQGARTDISQKSVKSHDTQKELARVAGVSHDTIHKVEVIQQKASPEAKEALKRGDVSINSVYSGIVSSEKADKKQEERKVLREAKERHEDYENKKADGVISFQNATQDREDKQVILEGLIDEYVKSYRAILSLGVFIKEGNFSKMISMMNGSERGEIREQFKYMQETINNLGREILQHDKK